MFKQLLALVAITTLFGCSEVASPQKESVKSPSPSQQTLYYGGDIITMNGEQPEYVEAVVERDGKIVYVGDKAGAQKKFGNQGTEIDLQGKTLLPSFLDAHGHFISAIQMVQQVNVASPPMGTVEDIPQLIQKLKDYRDKNQIPAGGWIVGWGYDQDLLTEKRHITKLDLDAALPDHKVLIIHVSMHGAVLNAKALEWADIDENTQTPSGGIIARLADSNEPAGLLMEMAYMPVFEKLPQPSQEEMLELMKPAQMLYASDGYTQAIEGYTHIRDLDFLQLAAEQNKIFLDILSLPGFDQMEAWLDNPKYPFGEYHNGLKIQACKITLDGSPQGKTALVTHDYLTGGPAGEKHWHGESSISQNQLDQLTQTLFEHDVPLQIHTNGDGAIDMMIKTIESAGKTVADDHRTVIVHSQFQRPDHLPRYAELGLVPAYFTQHTYYWGDVHINNIGREAANFISPIKAAKEAGLITSNHSDFNVTPLNPFFIMWTSMARESRTGEIIGADQRIDAYTALQTLTTGPAYQVFEENRKGKIKEGMLADFVIIDNNPLKQKVSDIRNNDVVTTIKEGKVIYQR